LADGPPEAVAYGSGTGIDRHKCEIVHRQPELAVLARLIRKSAPERLASVV